MLAYVMYALCTYTNAVHWRRLS